MKNTMINPDNRHHQSLPSGTVTFLFTDIESSTKLAQQYSEAYPSLLARHHSILQQSIQANDGYVFQIIGDAFCAAFRTAPDALNAALKAQRSLQHEDWQPAPVMVRMGIHTGVAQASVQVDGSVQYHGYLTLARVQDIMSSAHGGQVLLSSTCADLVQDNLPAKVVLRDLGEHQLKVGLNSEHLWQLVAGDLRVEFPPLKTPSVLPNNLPVQLNRLIGRERELIQIEELLSSTRLLTLTGPGGIGKTRLAIGAADRLLPACPQGVWFVPLDSLPSPEFLAEAMGAELGLSFSGQAPPREQLLEFLRRKDLLLVLDNFEHLLPQGTKLLVEILQKAPGIKLLVTSRQRLNLQAEWVLEISGLDYPKIEQHSAVEAYPSAELFMQHALRVSGRALRAEEVTCVGHITRMVEGAPLALELAAAWARALSCGEIAEEIERSLGFLQARQPDVSERHQSMKAVFDYSWGLLSDQEKSIFRKLSVFRGGFEREAASQVAEASLPTLAALVDKSLIYHRPDGRYRIHELLRQFAADELERAGENEATRARHLDYFVALAEQAEPRLTSADRKTWLARLDAERDNLVSALQLRPTSTDGNEKVLRLAGALGWFWVFRGTSEGRAQTEAVLKSNPGSSAARAKVMWAAGALAWSQGDYAMARIHLEESRALSQAAGDREGLAAALRDLGMVAMLRGDLTTARSHFEECEQLYREDGNPWYRALALALCGVAAELQGEYSVATTRLEESQDVFRKLKDGWGLSIPLLGLGLMACWQADYATARSLFEEALVLRREEGDPWNVTEALNLLGEVVQRQGELEKAVSLYSESLGLDQVIGDREKLAVVLHNLGSVAQMQGRHRRAARLFGAAQAVQAVITRPFTLTTAEDRVQDIASARIYLGEEQFSTAWTEGRAMTLEQAIEYALGVESK